MQYYEKNLKDERYDIDQHAFLVEGATDSSQLIPPLMQYVKNGKVSLILDEGRCNFRFFLKDTISLFPLTENGNGAVTFMYIDTSHNFVN